MTERRGVSADDTRAADARTRYTSSATATGMPAITGSEDAREVSNATQTSVD